MRLYAANGQRAEALRQYQACAALLDAELVTFPDHETTTLYEAILEDRLPGAGERNGAAHAPVTGILPPRPALTVGRAPALREVKRRLGIDGPEMRPVTVVQGWPGVGKSTLVALLAHDPDVARQFPDGVLWTSLGEDPSLSAAISAWAEALALNEPGRVRRVEEISAQLTAALRDRRVLLIVDDVWQVEHAAPFRVGGQACALLMTSASTTWPPALAPAADDVTACPSCRRMRRWVLGALPGAVARYRTTPASLSVTWKGCRLRSASPGGCSTPASAGTWPICWPSCGRRPCRGAGAQRHAGRPRRHRGDPCSSALDLLDAETRRRFAFLGLFDGHLTSRRWPSPGTCPTHAPPPAFWSAAACWSRSAAGVSSYMRCSSCTPRRCWRR